MDTARDILQRIADRLAQGASTIDVIRELVPRTRSQAVFWARRLPYWDELRGRFPDRAIATARHISKRSMMEHGLAFDDEGRVLEEPGEGRRRASETTCSFPLTLGEDTITVTYTRNYYGTPGHNILSFIGKEQIPPDDSPLSALLRGHKPHALSETGWYSAHPLHDAVEAMGGPEAYAAAFAAAKIAGREKEFEAAFTGRRPETNPRGRRKAEPTSLLQERVEQPEATQPTTEREVLGQHTARVAVEEREQVETPGKDKPTQQTLF